MFEARFFEETVELAEEWLHNASLEDVLNLLQGQSLSEVGLKAVISALYHTDYSRNSDIAQALERYLDHENKYVFMGALQYILRVNWRKRNRLLMTLPIPEHRQDLAGSLLQVLEEAR